MPSEREKAELAAATIKAFCKQFGPRDPSAVMLLDVLLQELYDVEVISLLGESGQKGDQVSYDTPVSPTGKRLIDRPGETTAPPSMGNTDTSNHL